MNIVILTGVLITLVTGIPVVRQMRRQHPSGLIMLFFAEMWERFSYYGMRALLIFYLTQHFLFTDAEGTQIYGSYASLVYLLPLFGGFLADRYLGTAKAVIFGAVLLVVGHGLMGYEGRPSTQTLVYQDTSYDVLSQGRGKEHVTSIKVGETAYVFTTQDETINVQDLPADAPLPATLEKGSYKYGVNRDETGKNIMFLALSFIVMGVGFLKPNISTIVGQLYPQGDPRRDAGFTLYYYGINLGAFWATALCGYLGQTIGWWAGFGLAGVGMLAGLIVFIAFKHTLRGVGGPPNPERLKATTEYGIYLAGVLGIAIVWFLVQRHDLVANALIGLTALSLVGILYIFLKVCQTRIERERLGLAMILIVGAVVFFTLFEQAGSSLNLFADRNVDLNLTPGIGSFLGIPYGTPAQFAAAGQALPGFYIDTTITAAQTQSFNAGFILIFAPLFAALWTFLGKRNLDPNPTMKFGLSLIQTGLGFLVVVWGATQADETFRVPLILLGGLYLLHTTGELFLSPVGLSQITKLAPASMVSFLMAVWFLSSSIAHFVGAIIAGMAGAETVGGEVVNPKAALDTSINVFQQLGYWGIGIGVAFALISFAVRRWSHEHEAPAEPLAAPPLEQPVLIDRGQAP